jgi:hypothetical protein
LIDKAAVHQHCCVLTPSCWVAFLVFTACAGSGLDDLSTPVQQQFEELSVTNPRLYFSHIQQQQPSQQGKGQQPQGLPVKQEQQGSQQQPQDVVRLLRGIDPNALTDQPMEPTVAGKVRRQGAEQPGCTCCWSLVGRMHLSCQGECTCVLICACAGLLAELCGGVGRVFCRSQPHRGLGASLTTFSSCHLLTCLQVFDELCEGVEYMPTKELGFTDRIAPCLSLEGVG